MVNLIKNEPVMLQGLVQAILGVVLAFGVDLTTEQIGSIMALTAVALAVAARAFVTPTNKLTVPPPVNQP